MTRHAILESAALTSRAKTLRGNSPGHPRAHADALLDKLGRTLFALPEWGLVTEVRNYVGREEPDVLRRADAIARAFYPRREGYRFRGFEVKIDRWDWLEEIQDPDKSGPFQVFCAAWDVVVPAPWNRIVHSLDEMPERWGLLEVGTGPPVVVVEAKLREAEPPTPEFEAALFRAALARRERDETRGDAPLTRINRIIDRRHVGLHCAHVTLAPMSKGALPRFLPCHGCADGRPTDFEYLQAALLDLSRADKQRLHQLLNGEVSGR